MLIKNRYFCILHLEFQVFIAEGVKMSLLWKERDWPLSSWVVVVFCPTGRGRERCQRGNIHTHTHTVAVACTDAHVHTRTPRLLPPTPTTKKKKKKSWHFYSTIAKERQLKAFYRKHTLYKAHQITFRCPPNRTAILHLYVHWCFRRRGHAWLMLRC